MKHLHNYNIIIEPIFTGGQHERAIISILDNTIKWQNTCNERLNIVLSPAAPRGVETLSWVLVLLTYFFITLVLLSV